MRSHAASVIDLSAAEARQKLLGNTVEVAMQDIIRQVNDIVRPLLWDNHSILFSNMRQHLQACQRAMGATDPGRFFFSIQFNLMTLTHRVSRTQVEGLLACFDHFNTEALETNGFDAKLFHVLRHEFMRLLGDIYPCHEPIDTALQEFASIDPTIVMLKFYHEFIGAAYFDKTTISYADFAELKPALDCLANSALLTKNRLVRLLLRVNPAVYKRSGTTTEYFLQVDSPFYLRRFQDYKTLNHLILFLAERRMLNDIHLEMLLMSGLEILIEQMSAPESWQALSTAALSFSAEQTLLHATEKRQKQILADQLKNYVSAVLENLQGFIRTVDKSAFVTIGSAEIFHELCGADSTLEHVSAILETVAQHIPSVTLRMAKMLAMNKCSSVNIAVLFKHADSSDNRANSVIQSMASIEVMHDDEQSVKLDLAKQNRAQMEKAFVIIAACERSYQHAHFFKRSRFLKLYSKDSISLPSIQQYAKAHPQSRTAQMVVQCMVNDLSDGDYKRFWKMYLCQYHFAFYQRSQLIEAYFEDKITSIHDVMLFSFMNPRSRTAAVMNELLFNPPSHRL